jgi:cytochrome c5
MKRKMLLVLSFALVAGAASSPAPAQAKAPIVLKSVEVTLPESTRTLPDGPGLVTVHNNCLTCHSAGMIMDQPTMAKAAWQAEVAKMRNVYKAPVDEKDVPAIVDYLTAVKGPKQP